MVTFPSLGSSRRLIWLRLVPMRSARRLRERFCAFIAAAICQASTSLMATASNSSSFPSSFRKSSRVFSPPVERAVFFFISSSSRRKTTFGASRRAVENDRHLPRPVSVHPAALYIVHVPYNVHCPQCFRRVLERGLAIEVVDGV